MYRSRLILKSIESLRSHFHWSRKLKLLARKLNTDELLANNMRKTVSKVNLHNISFVAGNLISIGPGLYESNHTLDGSARAVYVLNSCEFMHNGRLHSVHFYAGSADWLAIQIWRPFGGGSSSGRMKLVYQKYMDVKTHPDIYQVNL